VALDRQERSFSPVREQTIVILPGVNPEADEQLAGAVDKQA